VNGKKDGGGGKNVQTTEGGIDGEVAREAGEDLGKRWETEVDQDCETTGAR
jgi:hypothetical protein